MVASCYNRDQTWLCVYCWCQTPEGVVSPCRAITRAHPREFDTNNTHTIIFDPLSKQGSMYLKICYCQTYKIKGLLHHSQREASQRDASYAIDWVEGNSTGVYTIARGRLAPPAIKRVPEPFGLASSRDREQLHEGKHAFWQLTSGSSRVSGICHQSYQSFSMLNASNGLRDRLWCKDQGFLARKNISSARLPHGEKESWRHFF